VLKVPGPCYSVVGDESAWVTAIATAACWLELGQVDHVLVLGAEELDAVALEAYRTVGWSGKGSSFVAAEGAGAILLRQAGTMDRLRITAMAEGFTYRSKVQARRAASCCLESFGDGDRPLYRSAQNNWLKSVEEEAIDGPGRRVLPDRLPYCGEAFSASAAWHTLRALACLNPERSELRLPVWGLNEQIAALQLSLADAESNPVGSQEAIA
jgi:3-oxoacyl-(acyl-carrier-protein) synthase